MPDMRAVFLRKERKENRNNKNDWNLNGAKKVFLPEKHSVFVFLNQRLTND